jgi:hypothetical protein
MEATKLIMLGIGLAAIAGPTLSDPERKPTPPASAPTRSTTGTRWSATVTNTNPVIHYQAGQNTTGVTPGQVPMYNPTGLIPGQVPTYNPTNMTPGLPPAYNSTGMTPGLPPVYNSTGTTAGLPATTNPAGVTPGAPYVNYPIGVTTTAPTTYSYTTRTKKGAAVIHITNVPGGSSNYVGTTARRHSKWARSHNQTTQVN